MTTGDLNGDGKLDLAVAGRNISVLLNAGCLQSVGAGGKVAPSADPAVFGLAFTSCRCSR